MCHRFEERILAMPDPRRAVSQPAIQREVIAVLRPEQREVLSQEMEELFNLYGIANGSDLRNSRWDTTYLAADGQQRRSIVVINGATGKYGLVEGDRLVQFGHVQNIEIYRDGDVLRIAGEWFVQGQKRYFEWIYSPNAGDEFKGEWGYRRGDPPSGWWNGRLIP